ncbi:uncharacterized protein N0V89_012098 [Didymosphaeria variabile]|uniref:Uncharacterized protein n=1 Tax=Didymosphaeria variabile TaxID=1932322 RepID=A0A9W8X8R6_9PLEO|nr:uncharacterized protein N0V89_012098 [Didymosphaeria variabile]KAJ4344358.1 hypothetical protein N0V89_012098 [Didymosphaeria variabile]
MQIKRLVMLALNIPLVLPLIGVIIAEALIDRQAPEPDAERSPSPDLDPKRPSDGASKEPIVATPPKTGESLAHDMPVTDNLEKISPAD